MEEPESPLVICEWPAAPEILRPQQDMLGHTGLEEPFGSVGCRVLDLENILNSPFFLLVFTVSAEIGLLH